MPSHKLGSHSDLSCTTRISTAFIERRANVYLDGDMTSLLSRCGVILTGDSARNHYQSFLQEEHQLFVSTSAISLARFTYCRESWKKRTSSHQLKHFTIKLIKICMIVFEIGKNLSRTKSVIDLASK